MYCNIPYATTIGNNMSITSLYLHFIAPVGDPGEKFPLLIYVGGGGWRKSVPEHHLPELAFFAEKGFAVASVAYRTTETSIFPSQIEDVRTAIRYLRRHAAPFHIDPSNVFLMGGSAGGYLAAMAALTGETAQFRGVEYTDISDKVSGAICLYGIFDFPSALASAKGSQDQIFPLRLFVPETSMSALTDASPISYISDMNIPFLLLHGTEDKIVSYKQSVCFYDTLTKMDKEADLILLEGADHAGREFSQPAIQSIELDFLMKNLRRTAQ